MICLEKKVKSTEKVGETNEEMIVKKKRKRLFIILGIAAIVLIALKINKSRGFKDPFDDVDFLIENEISANEKMRDMNTLPKKLESDYKSGKLSADEYVMQSAYSIFEKDKLDSKYKDLYIDYYNPSALLKEVNGMYDKLSDETLMYVYKKFTLADVEWNVDEDKTEVKDMNNVSSDYEVKLMGDDNKLSKLDEVKLSDNGNFLIYYTKKGHNAITDVDAGRIASILEQSVDTYKSKFGFDYKYNAYFEFFSVAMTECPTGTAKGRACKLLKNNNIDTKYLNTAMPVYIIDTGDDNVLGYYFPYVNDIQQIIVKVSTIFKDYGEAMEQVAATYSFPYFVVNSNISNLDNTNIVSAHELFHHYQHYICGDGKYADCPSGNFTIETTANYASINVNNINNINTAINGHAAAFTQDSELSIDKAADGYGAFVFTYNYGEIVPDGSKYIFESLKAEDRLDYLARKAGNKYKDVLVTTAEKNITHDYDNKLVVAARDGSYYYPSSHEAIGYENVTKTNSMDYSSSHYYFTNPRGYKKGTQLSFSGNSRDLTLLMFVWEDNSYRKVYTHTLNDEDFVININEFSNYGQLAFALVNSKTNETLRYTYKVDTNGSKKVTVSPEDLGLTKFERNINDFTDFSCYQVEDNSSYNVITQIKLSFNKKDKIDDMYVKGTIRLKEFAPDDPAYKIAKNLVSGAFRLMQIAYKEQFKYFRVITEEQDDKYMITFKITKNYYDALNNSMKINGQSKFDIITEIEGEGFTCQYSK